MLTSYGVLRGPLTSTGSHQGQWLHELLYVTVGSASYECAVDVNEPTLGFQYQILNNLDQTLFQSILQLTDGYYTLTSSADSGAVDYKRSPLFLNLSEVAWIKVDGDEAGTALLGMIQTATTLFVFGAPYDSDGKGMHDIHCNQGDPVNSE